GFLSTRYGSVADMVVSLTAVNGAGEILRTLEGPSAGPDLAQLLLGSEGTLAIFTEARLRVCRRPREKWLRAVRFASLREALGAVREVLRVGLRPPIVRLLDPLDTLFAAADPIQVPQPLKWLAEGAQGEALRLALRAPQLLNRLIDALAARSSFRSSVSRGCRRTRSLLGRGKAPRRTSSARSTRERLRGALPSGRSLTKERPSRTTPGSGRRARCFSAASWAREFASSGRSRRRSIHTGSSIPESSSCDRARRSRRHRGGAGGRWRRRARDASQHRLPGARGRRGPRLPASVAHPGKRRRARQRACQRPALRAGLARPHRIGGCRQRAGAGRGGL